MGIVVGHEQNGRAKAIAALSVLAEMAARRQAEEQAQAEQAPPDVLEQLSQTLANRVNPQPPQQGGGPSYAMRPRDQQPSYSRGGGSSPRAAALRSLAPGYNEKFNQQAQRDVYGAQVDLQQQREREQAQLEQQQLTQAGMMARQQADDLPDWILQGKADGSLRWSASQKKDRQDLLDGIDKAYRDPSWSPQDRARLEAMNLAKVRQIDMSPQTVPLDERPRTPQQEVEARIWVDPDTGVKYHIGSRGGDQKLDPLENPKAKADEAQAKLDAANQRFEQVQEQHRQEVNNTAYMHQLEARQARVKGIQQQEQALTAAKLKRFEAIRTDAQLRANPKNEGMVGPPLDLSIYDNQITELERDLKDARAEHYARLQVETADSLPGAMAGMSMLPIPGTDPNAGLPPSAPPPAAGPPAITPPPDATAQDLQDFQAVRPQAAVAPPPQAPQDWATLPNGTITTLPNGRKVRKTGPTTAEAVQ